VFGAHCGPILIARYKSSDLTGPAVEFGFAGERTGAMPGKIFINYRRAGSTDTAGRLYDRIAQAVGHKNLFVDLVGVDLKERLKNQVPMCQAFLTVIGPSWLDAKDEAGRPRIHSPDDFVAVEIVAALAHNIPVIPVLVDGAHMPQVSELPDSLEPLARIQAVEVRRPHFDRDAEALVERVRKALNNKAFGHARWRARTLAGAAVAAVLILIGTSTYIFVQHILGQSVQWEERRAAEAETNRKAEEAGRQARAAAEAEINRKVEEAEKQRLATERERQTRAAAEAEANRKNDEAEQQRAAALRAEEEERKRAEAEGQARYTALISQGSTDSHAGEYDKAIADYNEAIRLDPESILAFMGRGDAYTNKGDYDRALADYNEAIRLNPRSALALSDRGVAYASKGDYDRALADFNEAIRLDPKSAHAFRNRGVLYAHKGDNDRALADFNEAIRLDRKGALTFRDRGDLYMNKGDYDHAIADYNEAIQFDPNNALAFCNRGRAKRNINDATGNTDIAKAKQLDASACR
jgi:tetratricopeptide (TPR) repeat protein